MECAEQTTFTTARSKAILESAKTIVLKIGSALLVDDQTGTIKTAWLDALAEDVADMKRAGKQVVLVSSGAVGVGRTHLGLPAGPLKLEIKQAAAATGQGRLAHAYQEALAPHGLTAAQVLITPTDTEDRRRYLNARTTLSTLLKLGAVPIINENDTVATQELRFGDNDRLAARIAQMMAADALLLFSDIDGLYTADPRTTANACHIPVVQNLTPDIMAMGGDAGSSLGTGGMYTKLQAAKICMFAGCQMVIAPGAPLYPVRALAAGGRCTWFIPQDTPGKARKHWIGGSLQAKGCVHIDAGALTALQTGKSLLPVGVTHITGQFDRGDAVDIIAPDGHSLGKGLIAHRSDIAIQLIGLQSDAVHTLLGYQGRDELIHRDNMALDDPIRIPS